jgi:hypothetical protein
MKFIIVGGGCYGTFYTQQLLKARDAGAVQLERIVVVDRNEAPRARTDVGADPDVEYLRSDWDRFFDEYFNGSICDPADQFVPSPFNPHLGLAWLTRLVRQSGNYELDLEDFSVLPATPYREQRAHGTLVASHADWICPVHCVEPETCPKTRGPRHWDMDLTARALADQLAGHGQKVDEVHLFHCHHVTYGVGAYPASELLAARDALFTSLAERGSVRFLIGTVSRCHGAMHLLAVRRGMVTVSPNTFLALNTQSMARVDEREQPENGFAGRG